MAKLSHFLVPVDFTEASGAALDRAVELAGTLGARVTVLHVYYLPAYDFPDASYIPTPEEVSRLAEAAGRKLDALVAPRRERGVAVETKLVSGDAAEEIVAEAGKVGADLIVMGTHGRGAFRTALLGSVAQKVVRAAPVPVMTVRGA